jgi:hypothetical protein
MRLSGQLLTGRVSASATSRRGSAPLGLQPITKRPPETTMSVSVGDSKALPSVSLHLRRVAPDVGLLEAVLFRVMLAPMAGRYVGQGFIHHSPDAHA